MKKVRIFNIVVILSILMLLSTGLYTLALADNKTVRIVYEDWSSEIASTNLVKAVIREKLGYKCIIKRMSITEQFAAISDGSQDAMVGAWLPGQSVFHDKYKDQIIDLGPNLEGTRLGLVVPNVSSTALLAHDASSTEPYLKIDSIAQIKDHYDDFKGKIIGIESDSAMMNTMRERVIPEYGLEEFELIPGTEVSMIAELASAIKKRSWVVVLGWTPHWKFGRWALKFLDDPKNTWGGEGSIHTMVRKGFKEDMPDVYRFLDAFHWNPEDMELLLLWNEMGGTPYDNAKRWIRSNPEIVESWLK
jgi:glycine betaine/proline transport system substrate-binding protein